MKKLILILTTAFVCGMMLTGCKTSVTKDVDYAFYQNMFNQFVVVEERTNGLYGTLSIMYDKDTKVMYYMIIKVKCLLILLLKLEKEVSVFPLMHFTAAQVLQVSPFRIQ